MNSSQKKHFAWKFNKIGTKLWLCRNYVAIQIFQGVYYLIYILGYVYKDVYVNVLSLPPEILNPPAKQSRVVQGEPVTITCKTFGAPKPLIKWFHDGRELYGDRYDLMADGNLVIKYVVVL